MKKSTELVPSDNAHLGPAMRALPTEQMRRFVVEMCNPTATGELNYTEAAAAAGYGTSTSSREYLRVAGHRLAHDERIQAAMLEEGQRRLGAAIPLATASLIKILQDPALKAGVQMKAAGMILNRAGLPEKTVHDVNVRRELSEEEKVEKAISIAKALGLDPKQVLGAAGINLPDETPVVEAEIVGTTEGLEDLLP